MAAPHRNRSQRTDPAFEKTRKKIQTTQLVNALVKHVLGENKMKPSQVTAGLGLLKKVLPDLSAVEVEAQVDAKVNQITRVELVAPEADDDGKD